MKIYRLKILLLLSILITLVQSLSLASEDGPAILFLKPFWQKYLYSTEEYKQETLNRINYHRDLAGLNPLTISDVLCQASQAHADYLNINNLATHEEDSSKTGFTGQWAKDRANYFGYDWASIGEVISFGLDAEEGVDSLIKAIYHRIILLGPQYTEVGIGDASHPTYGMVQVINPARPKNIPAPTNIIAVYPANQQEDVPIKFDSDQEWPDPVPDKGVVGYPVSVHLSDDYNVILKEFTISLNGTQLDAKIIHKGNDSNIKSNAFALIPMDPLEPSTVYDVYFEAEVNGNFFSKKWTFTTEEAKTLQASPSTITIAVGETGEVKLVNVESPYKIEWDNSEIISVTPEAGFVLKIKGLKAGNTNITVTDATGATVTITVYVVTLSSLKMDISTGWNLLSFYLKPIDSSVDTMFEGVSAEILSLWKWQKDKWSVYLPSLEDGGSSYAQSKGFNLLTQIDVGEGFWINAKQAFSVDISGIPASDTTLNLYSGWNLVGLKTDKKKAISEFISANKDKILSIWKWLGNTWAVYLPSLGEEATQNYADSKGFSVLTEINPAEGFWVNTTEDISL